MRLLNMWAVGAAATAALAAGSVPGPGTLAGWRHYIASAERRLAAEMASGGRFLGTDFAPDAAARRAAVLGGDILIDRVAEHDGSGEPLTVDDGLVHHWRGAVLVPGARLETLLSALESQPPRRQPDVLQAALLDRGPGRARVHLRVQRRQIVTVVYDTEHVVTFHRNGPARASSASTAVRIVEIRDAGTPHERPATPGEDRGFLWRWQAYWRYEQVPQGVVAECESVSLSRSVPAVLRYMAAPLIRRTAHESMETTLAAVREEFRAR
jgi:hypothetical protein